MQGRRLFLLFFRLFTELLAGFTTWYKDVSPPSFFLFSKIVSRIHDGGIEMSITSFSFFFRDYRQRWRSLWYDRMMPIISFYLSLFFANADKVHDVVSVIRYRFAFFFHFFLGLLAESTTVMSITSSSKSQFLLFSGITDRVHDVVVRVSIFFLFRSFFLTLLAKFMMRYKTITYLFVF